MTLSWHSPINIINHNVVCNNFVVLDLNLSLILFQIYFPERFVRQLTSYTIVTPILVDESGNFVSHNLQEWHRIQRREAAASNTTSDDIPVKGLPHLVHYKINLNGDAKDSIVHLELTQNNMLLSPGFVIERRRGNSTLSDTTFDKGRSSKFLCHYTGKLKDHGDSVVAISLCDGLVSIIFYVSNHFLMWYSCC